MKTEILTKTPIEKVDLSTLEDDKTYFIINESGRNECVRGQWIKISLLHDQLPISIYLPTQSAESKQQLPVVKDWDEVFKDYFDNERNTGSDHNLIDFLKQNYSLKVSPSDEVLKIWLKSFVFDALRCQTQEIDELVNAGIPNLRTLFSEVK